MHSATVLPFDTTQARKAPEANDPKAVAIQQFGAVLNRCETLVTHSRSQGNKRILTGHLSYLRAQMRALEDSATDGDRSRILSEITDYLGYKFMAPFEKSLKSGKFKAGGYLDKLFTQLVDGFNGLGEGLLGQSFDNGETLRNKLEINGLRSQFRARAKQTAEVEEAITGEEIVVPVEVELGPQLSSRTFMQIQESEVNEGSTAVILSLRKLANTLKAKIRSQRSTDPEGIVHALNDFESNLVVFFSNTNSYHHLASVLNQFETLTHILSADKSNQYSVFVRNFLTYVFPHLARLSSNTEDSVEEHTFYGEIPVYYGRAMGGNIKKSEGVPVVIFTFPFANELPSDHTFSQRKEFPDLDHDEVDFDADTDIDHRTEDSILPGVGESVLNSDSPTNGKLAFHLAGHTSGHVVLGASEEESAPHVVAATKIGATLKANTASPPNITMPRRALEQTQALPTGDEGFFTLAAALAEEEYTVPQYSNGEAVHAAFFGGSNEVQKKEGTDFSADPTTAAPLTLQAEIPTPSSAPASTVVPDSQFVPTQRPKLTRSRSVLGGIVLGFGLTAGQAPWTVAPIGECVDVETSTLPDEPTSEAFVPLSVQVGNRAETVKELEQAILGAHDWKEVRSAHPWIESDAALTAFTRDLENWGGWEKPLDLYAKAEKNGAVFSSPSDLLAFWDASPELAQGTALSAAREIAFELRPEINSSLEPVAELHEEASRQYIATGDGAVPFMLDQAQFESDVSQDALEQDWFNEGDSMEAAEAAPQTAPVQSVRDRVRKFLGKMFS